MKVRFRRLGGSRASLAVVILDAQQIPQVAPFKVLWKMEQQRSWSRLIVEGLVIVFSILLALILNAA